MNLIKRALTKRKTRRTMRTLKDLRSIRRKVMMSGTFATLAEIDIAIKEHGINSEQTTRAKVNLAVTFLSNQFKHTHLMENVTTISQALSRVETRKKQLTDIKRQPARDEFYRTLVEELKSQFKTPEEYIHFLAAYRIVDSDVRAIMSRVKKN